MYGNITIILGSILFVILFLAMMNLSKKINNNKEKIEKLESDLIVFCNGNLTQIKLKDLFLLLLDLLDYNIISSYPRLVKRQKNKIKN